MNVIFAVGALLLLVSAMQRGSLFPFFFVCTRPGRLIAKNSTYFQFPVTYRSKLCTHTVNRR